MGKASSTISITLGYFLDGHAFPGPLEGKNAVQGVMTLGPMGFLGILQTWLGLPNEPCPGGKRIAQCLRAARACCCEKREPFYARSIATAPWAAAQRLLAMRDALALSGWAGESPAKGSPHLADLAALHRKLPPAADLPARLSATIEALELWPLPHDMRVTLLEPTDAWPQCWRRLFASLQRRGVRFSSWEMPSQPAADSSLARLQAFMRGNAKRAGTVDDGSLVLLRSGSVEEAAEAVALLLPRWAGEGSTVLVRTDPGLALEEALARFHQPLTGYAPESRWRGILQLLPICLRMRWKPRSMQALLDFLLLDEAPVYAMVRRYMVKALREFPGIGNEEWQKKAEEAQTELREKYGDAAEAKWKEALRWLEPEVVSEDPGMPLAVVESVCADLAKWALQRSDTRPDNGLLKVLAAQATDFADMAREAGEAFFTRPTLESMLDHECALGADHVFSQEEAAPWKVVDHPGQLHGPMDTLVWWQFRAPAGIQRNFWTEEERQWLDARHLAPADMEEDHRLQYAAWKRALCLTRKQCVLVLPDREAGEEIEPHPFWDHISTSFVDDNARALFSRSAKAMLADLDAPCAPAEPLEIPDEPDEPLRLEPQPMPDSISVTEADNAMNCPFRGLLMQRLKPEGPKAAFISNMPQVFGMFSHKLIQLMLEAASLPAPGKAADAMEALAEQLYPTHAAILLEPQHLLSRQSFLRSMRRVAEDMVSRLGRCHLSSPQTELKLHKKLASRETELCGRADVCLTSGRTPVIWDLKWSKGTKKYAALLDEASAWQLAAYAWMMDSGVKDAAYWLLPNDEFMGTAGSGAEDTEVHEIDLAAVWDAMSAELETVFSEWEQGIAAIAGRDAKGRVKKESGCDYCDMSFVCGRGYA